MPEPRIGVVGATGAVGSVTMRLLAERGYRDVRAFASARSAGTRLETGSIVEEATPEALERGDIDVASSPSARRPRASSSRTRLQAGRSRSTSRRRSGSPTGSRWSCPR